MDEAAHLRMMALGPTAQPSLDWVLHILANRYRRRLLVALLERNPRYSDPQIIGSSSIEDETRERRLLQMIHTHLPKLERAGFIVRDGETDAVRRGPQFEEIRPLIELLDDHTDELPGEWV